MKRIRHWKVAAATALGALPLGTALAIPIRLDTIPYIQPATTLPGNPPNQGVPTVHNWLQDLVQAYNLQNDPDLPVVAASPSLEYTENREDVRSLWINVTGYTYLTVHWGGKKSSDHSQAWYLGGALENFHLVSPTGRGLSGYRLWNYVPPDVMRVPEGGTTLTLLGLGLLATFIWPRRARHPNP